MGITDLLEYFVYTLLIPILLITSTRLAMKRKLHGNLRFNVTLMTLSVFWMLVVRIVTLITANWEDKDLVASISNVCYYAMQAGYNWYRGSFFSFIIERFVCAQMTHRYENLNSIRVKMGFGALTFLIVAIVMSLLLVATTYPENEDFFNTFAFIWMFTLQLSTLPMTGYVLYRTKQDWSARHEGASLSQRFQIAESRTTAKLFLPLTASNFLCVLFLLGNLAAIAFGELSLATKILCWTMLDWLDFYQRIFYVGCIVRTEADCLNRVLQYLSNLSKRKKNERRNTISVTPIPTKTDTDEYFKNYKTMWA